MVAVTEKRKRVSKKNKRAWRKHTDVKDVEEYLDEKRLEERLGAPFTERLDEELFLIDTVAEPAKEEQVKVTKPKKEIKPPKCFAILEMRSAVPDPIKKRNRVKTKEEREHPLVKRIREERTKNGILTLKERLAERNREVVKARKESKPKRGEFTVDLWENEGSATENDLGPGSEWLNPTTKFHTLKNTGRLRKKKPETFGKKPSPLTAIDAPHPGASYNPSFSDHQSLLQQVAENEMKLIKKEEHLKRVTSDMFSKVTPQEQHNIWIAEASEGLPGVKPTTEESEASGDEYKTVNPPVQNKKKTLKKRRKIKEAKLEQLKIKQLKTQKKKITDIYKLRQMNKELEKRQEKLEMLRRKREKVKALKELEPKTLSKTKFEPLEPEFNLSEELSGNLRGIKPNGSILSDRFKSLQQRSIIQPTVLQKVKRAKVKRYEKKSHKMGWEPKGY